MGRIREHSHRREMREEFVTQFGLRQGYEANLKKQFDSDISQVTNKSGVTKDESKKETTSNKDRSFASNVSSKETKLPIKEKSTKEKDATDDSSSPPESSDTESVRSVPSIVKPKKLSMDAPNIDDSGEGLRKKKGKRNGKLSQASSTRCSETFRGRKKNEK
jgi:hypothetical protein